MKINSNILVWISFLAWISYSGADFLHKLARQNANSHYSTEFYNFLDHAFISANPAWNDHAHKTGRAILPNQKYSSKNIKKNTIRFGEYEVKTLAQYECIHVYMNRYYEKEYIRHNDIQLYQNKLLKIW